MLDLLHSFFFSEFSTISMVLFFVLFEIFLQQVKRRMKRTIFAQYDKTTDPSDNEYYLEYYRRSQYIDIIRIISVSLGLILLVGYRFHSGINILAVAMGAIIISLKDILLSVIAFFFIIRQYRVWDTIQIGQSKGHIIFVRMFSVGIIGKDADGESTGQLDIIPNYRFLTESVRKEELGANEIIRDFFYIPYKKEWFEWGFDTFIEDLRKHLDLVFSLGNRRNVGHYQSYIGHRYKIDYEYKEEKCLYIHLTFLGTSAKNKRNIERIISWVERKKKVK